VSFKDALFAIGIFILSVLMAFYALRDYDTIGENIELHLRSLFGDKLVKPFKRVFHMTDKAMRSFLLGKLYTCLILGIMIGLFGLIFNLISPKDIPYLPLIAFIIGLTNIIPYVGPFIGTVPSLVFALINGFIPGLALLAIVLISQQIDNILISPKILGQSVGLKPFWVLLSVTIGGRLFGILGMLLTVPFTSVILLLLDERITVYKKNLNKEKL
jgi:predicted PurR-regulated permease PerM